MEYYRYHEFCLCPRGGKLPEGATLSAEPFTPLVFLVERDPLTSRGWFAIRSLAELDEPEGINLLLPPPEAPWAAGFQELTEFLMNRTEPSQKAKLAPPE